MFWMFVSALWCQASNRVTYYDANEAVGWERDGSFSTGMPLRVVVTVVVTHSWVKLLSVWQLCFWYPWHSSHRILIFLLLAKKWGRDGFIVKLVKGTWSLWSCTSFAIELIKGNPTSRQRHITPTSLPCTSFACPNSLEAWVSIDDWTLKATLHDINSKAEAVYLRLKAESLGLVQ